MLKKERNCIHVIPTWFIFTTVSIEENFSSGNLILLAYVVDATAVVKKMMTKSSSA
jgi:hypothetical protein